MEIAPLLLEGGPYERGLVHGESLRRPIAELLERWKEALAEDFAMDADEAIGRFLAGTGFPDAIGRHTPGLLEEVRGIAAGAGQPYETMLAFQYLDEFWAGREVITEGHCTSIGLDPRPGEPAWLAQNMDLESFRDGYQVILRLNPSGAEPEALVLTNAGMIGLNGVNAGGLGICCNTLIDCNSRLDGLPVACVVRGVLAQPDPGAAEAFLRRIPHACGQNYLVGDPQRIVDLECSANQVTPYRSDTIGGAVWHANLPLANTDTRPGCAETSTRAEKSPHRIDSEARFDSVARQLQQAVSAPRLDILKRILASQDPPENPICSLKTGPGFHARVSMFSFAVTIMELSARPALHASFTPGDTGSYTRLGFE
ncbi:MAG: hypothetical protein JW785_01400 [Acidimicrobiia bacterium]|nr:hypothetical protein [Acidimicrobiia bacterium]